MTTDLYTTVALYLARQAAHKQLSPKHYLIGFGFPIEDAEKLAKRSENKVYAEVAACIKVSQAEISAIALTLQGATAA